MIVRYKDHVVPWWFLTETGALRRIAAHLLPGTRARGRISPSRRLAEEREAEAEAEQEEQEEVMEDEHEDEEEPEGKKKGKKAKTSSKTTTGRPRRNFKSVESAEEYLDQSSYRPVKMVKLVDLIPPLPDKGEFDVTKIKQSLYFFS